MNAVLAASSSTAAVTAWMMKNGMLSAPNTAVATCEMRLGWTAVAQFFRPMRSHEASA